MKTRLGTTRQGKVYIAVSLVLLGGSLYSVGAHAKHKRDAPIYTLGSGVADPNQAGNIDQAVTQTQQLLSALQSVNYDPVQLPDYNLMTLPDAQFAESEDDRQSDVSSYVFPDATMPEQSAIACYTDIYARTNRSYYTGDTSTAAPSGYFIVAWKNGTVQKVPVADVRRMTKADGTGIDCFPGMTGYDPALPHWRQ